MVNTCHPVAYYLALLTAVLLFVFSTSNPALSLSLIPKTHHRLKGIPRLPPLPPCDLQSPVASADAVLLADQLKLTPLLHQLQELRQRAQTYKTEKPPLETREQIRELKEDISERIQQTRLEIDFTQSELAMDIALQSELLRNYTEARDSKVNAVNTWSFRTNGVLWAIAEGLDIPTYSRPRLSIPSGTVGILAGLVPSVFSLVALGELKGGHYDGTTRPNMLSKIFDYPTTPQIEYPDSIMAYLRSSPANNIFGKSRLDFIIDRWATDENIHSFTDRHSTKQLDLITGKVESRLTIEIVCDRLTMLQQLSAIIQQMNRPLLELMMVTMGSKYFN